MNVKIILKLFKKPKLITNIYINSINNAKNLKPFKLIGKIII